VAEARVQAKRATREHLTDLGNAKRLVKNHGQDFRFCTGWERWFVWDGTRWIEDGVGDIMRRAKKIASRIYREARDAQSVDRRRAIRTWARMSESVARLNAMVDLAKTEWGIPVMPDQLDTDPWVLNCLNGTLDLRDGVLHPHRREDLCTRIVPVVYDPGAKSPLWDKFLNRILPDEGVRCFVQRAVGYSLTGVVREQVLFFLIGGGANGKSTLVGVLLGLLRACE
jgi:putative DNA primase/helicase